MSAAAFTVFDRYLKNFLSGTAPANTEQQLAIYSRRYPEKILFLMTPSTEKLVYTPFAVSMFNFDSSKLPSYRELLILFQYLKFPDGTDPQFITLVYKKNRTAEQVKSCIREQDHMNKIYPRTK